MMALSLHTLSFASSAGFAFDPVKIEFAAGVCRLKAGVFGAATVTMTTDIDCSGWDALAGFAPVVVEQRGYEHRFLLSFDSGLTWRTYRGGRWHPVPLAAAFAAGLTAHQLGRQLELPATEQLRVAVAIQRENIAGPPAGSLASIGVYHLAAGDPEVAVAPVMREVPADTSALVLVPPGYAWPWEANPEIYAESHEIAKGYTEACATATRKARESVRLTYPASTLAAQQALAATFRANYGAAMKLRSLHEELAGEPFRFFTPASEPSLRELSPGVWELQIQMMELIP